MAGVELLSIGKTAVHEVFELWHGSWAAMAWLLGGQCLSLADYVTVTAPTGEAVAAGCR